MTRTNKQVLSLIVSGTVPIAFWLLSALPSPAFNYDDIVWINEAERKAFGHENSSASLDERLRALESRLFGSARSGSDSQRVKAVCASLGLRSAEPAGRSAQTAQTEPEKPAIQTKAQARETTKQDRNKKSTKKPASESKPSFERSAAKTSNPGQSRESTSTSPEAQPVEQPTASTSDTPLQPQPVDQAPELTPAPEHEFPLIPLLLFGGVGLAMAVGLGVVAYVLVNGRQPQTQFVDEEAAGGQEAGTGGAYPHRQSLENYSQTPSNQAAQVEAQTEPVDQAPADSFVPAAQPQAHSQPSSPKEEISPSPNQEISLPPAAGGTSEYLPIFLAPVDLGAMQLAEDERHAGIPFNDKAFARFRGEFAGHAIWAGSSDSLMAWVGDWRWTFPNDESAALYYSETLKSQADGLPWIGNAAKVGSESHLFGGKHKDRIDDQEYTVYAYMIRCGRVVAKLHITQGPESAAALSTDHLVGLAQRAAARIKEHVVSEADKQPEQTLGQPVAPFPSQPGSGPFSGLASQWSQSFLQLDEVAKSSQPAPTVFNPTSFSTAEPPGTNPFVSSSNAAPTQQPAQEPPLGAQMQKIDLKPTAAKTLQDLDAISAPPKEHALSVAGKAVAAPQSQPDTQPDIQPDNQGDTSSEPAHAQSVPAHELPSSQSAGRQADADDPSTDANLQRLLDVFKEEEAKADDPSHIPVSSRRPPAGQNPKLRAPLGSTGKLAGSKAKPSSQELRNLFSEGPAWEPEKEDSEDEPHLVRYPGEAHLPPQEVAQEAAAAEPQTSQQVQQEPMPSGPPKCCLIVLLDQSAAMSEDDAGSMLSETAALLLNRFIHGFVRRWKKHQGSPPVWYVSVIGYGDAVGSALIGKHQAKDLVTVLDLSTTSASENRPGVEGRSTIIGIPVWVLPRSGGPSRVCAALEAAERVAKRFLNENPGANAPVVVNIGAGTVSDGDPRAACEVLRQLQGKDGPVRLFNCQLTKDANYTVSLPTIGTDVQDPASRLLYEISSPLPICEDLIGFIRHNQVGHIGRLLDMVTALEE